MNSYCSEQGTSVTCLTVQRRWTCQKQNSSYALPVSHNKLDRMQSQHSMTHSSDALFLSYQIFAEVPHSCLSAACCLWFWDAGPEMYRLPSMSGLKTASTPCKKHGYIMHSARCLCLFTHLNGLMIGLVCTWFQVLAAAPFNSGPTRGRGACRDHAPESLVHTLVRLSPLGATGSSVLSRIFRWNFNQCDLRLRLRRSLFTSANIAQRNCSVPVSRLPQAASWEAPPLL